MEIITQLQDPAIIAATMVIVGLIKDKGFLAKIPTKLVSLAVSLVLFGLATLLEPSVEWVLNVEKILVVILPAIGYDYIYKPLLKPIVDVLSKRNPTN